MYSIDEASNFLINWDYEQYYNENLKQKEVARAQIPPAAQKLETTFAQQSAAEVAKASALSQVPQVPYVNGDEIREKLRPGDIILSYYPSKSSDLVAFFIRAGQRFFSQSISKDLESHNFVHAGLYVGDGIISEALKNGIRISDIEGERFKLKPGARHGFLIVRPKNKKMAAEAARIAESLSAKGENRAPLEYSISKALFSSLKTPTDELDHKALKRYLKGAYYAQKGEMPRSKSGIRDFFCSYFIGWACQAGESQEVLDRINARLSPSLRISIPDLSHLKEEERPRALSGWADFVAKRHAGLLNKEISLKLDSRFLTPQHFFEFILKHPELFGMEMLLVPPTKES